MSRTTKKKAAKSKPSKKGFSIFDDDERPRGEEEEDLPKDEAGRRKIKRQYEELLGIRIDKLRGRILNRERIDKAVEGIYFICVSCRKVCHNLDEGLVEDPDNARNICVPCSQGGGGGREQKGRAA